MYAHPFHPHSHSIKFGMNCSFFSWLNGFNLFLLATSRKLDIDVSNGVDLVASISKIDDCLWKFWRKTLFHPRFMQKNRNTNTQIYEILYMSVLTTFDISTENVMQKLAVVQLMMIMMIMMLLLLLLQLHHDQYTYKASMYVVRRAASINSFIIRSVECFIFSKAFSYAIWPICKTYNTMHAAIFLRLSHCVYVHACLGDAPSSPCNSVKNEWNIIDTWA